MGYVILLWHSLSLPYNYFEHLYCTNMGLDRNKKQLDRETSVRGHAVLHRTLVGDAK